MDQPGLRVAVEVAVWLVQHHQLGPAEHGPRQADELALATREIDPALADAGLIAVRQTQDHLVTAGGLGRLVHLLGLRMAIRAMFSKTVTSNSSTSWGR